jgi:hypothetical protein
MDYVICVCYVLHDVGNLAPIKVGSECQKLISIKLQSILTNLCHLYAPGRNGNPQFQQAKGRRPTP